VRVHPLDLGDDALERNLLGRVVLRGERVVCLRNDRDDYEAENGERMQALHDSLLDDGGQNYNAFIP
jgi:hypothetical protein